MHTLVGISICLWSVRSVVSEGGIFSSIRFSFVFCDTQGTIYLFFLLFFAPRWLILLHFSIWCKCWFSVSPVVVRGHSDGNIWVFHPLWQASTYPGWSLVSISGFATKHFCLCLKPSSGFSGCFPPTVYPHTCFPSFLLCFGSVPHSWVTGLQVRLWGIIRKPSCNFSSFLDAAGYRYLRCFFLIPAAFSS